MKHRATPLRVLALVVLLPLGLLAQLNNGGLYSGFGVDADTRANFMKMGLITGAVTSDDWFAPSGNGFNVIDTSGAATYLALLQGGANIQFSKGMSQLLYAKVNGKLWLDAAYARDFSAAASFKDSTVFSIAAKNGDNPNVWQGGVANAPTKNDLVDVYGHMRRDGISVYDSLWFFTGITVFGSAANSYYNVELYRNPFTYNATTQRFASAGTSGGHSQWLFDAAGNVTRTGDMIVAVSFAPGSVPVIEVRIWVSQATYTTMTGALSPKYFNFSSYSAGSGVFGYASIVSKTGSTAFGAGISNDTGNPLTDTTYSTPWGTSNNVTGFSTYYQAQQFIEVGLNLTRIGVDPALYSTLNPCQPMFSNLFFASRSSSSFTANLQDFVTPLTFLQQPVMDFAVQGDTLRCNRPVGTITLTNKTTAGYYTWQTASGATISGANGDSSQLAISKPGTYIVSASPAEGCPATQLDTIVVPIDTFPPVASATPGMTNNQLILYGGNVAASNYPTPFGGSQGLDFNWTGPSGFASGVQNPVTDTVWGTYNLTVTEKRNGCTATASTNVVAGMFDILLADGIDLRGVARSQQVDLSWSDLHPAADRSFVVERSDGVHDFEEIGTVGGDGTTAFFAFTDMRPLKGNNLYRIKALASNGGALYSPTITIGFLRIGRIYLATNAPGGPTLFVTMGVPNEGMLVEYDISGRILEKRMFSFGQGVNTVIVGSSPPGGGPRVHIFALYENGQIAWCEKVVF
jgi:hypothetical protein